MSFSIPNDLIRQAQLATRAAAGLTKYDPSDPTRRPFPSLESPIASLDPSPPYLRCKECNGKLLRGVQSIVCVYCGKRRNDVVVDDMKFNETVGYRWLLESLQLDGSDIVGSLKEGDGSSRAQSRPINETLLSELLDLQLSWPAEPKKPEDKFKNKIVEPGNGSVNVTGVNLDKIFSTSRNDLSEILATTHNQVESTGRRGLTDEENNVSFQNALPTETNATETNAMSTMDVGGVSSSGWEADFQSADNNQQESQSFDPFVASSSDLSAHMDSVFGHKQELNEENLTHEPASIPFTDDAEPVEQRKSKSVDPSLGPEYDPSAGVDFTFDSAPLPSTVNGWVENDPWSNINSSVPHQASEFGPAVEAKEGLSPENLTKSVSESDDFDLFQETNWQNGSTDSMPNRDDDPFERSLKLDGGTLSPLNSNLSQHDVLDNFDHPASQPGEQFDFASINKANSSSDIVNKPSTENLDWFQDNFWQSNTAISKGRVNNEDSDHFDEWNNFTSSAVDQGPKNSFKQNSTPGSTGILPRIDADPFEKSPKPDAVAPPLFNDPSQHDILDSFGPLVSQPVEQLDSTSISKLNVPSGNVNKQSTENVDWFQDDLWLSNVASKGVVNNEDDNSFDEWNDFTSSTGDQDPSKNSRGQSRNDYTADSEQMPDLSLLSMSKDFPAVEFSTFSQSDIFSGLSSSLNLDESRGVKKMLSEVHTDARASEDKVGGMSEGPEKNGAVSSGTTNMQNEAEMIISKMHDLSFMLESNLSIPLKKDTVSDFPNL